MGSPSLDGEGGMRVAIYSVVAPSGEPVSLRLSPDISILRPAGEPATERVTVQSPQRFSTRAWPGAGRYVLAQGAITGAEDLGERPESWVVSIDYN